MDIEKLEMGDDLLSHQLSNAIARICKIEPNDLLEVTMSLLLEALAQGDTSISMPATLASSGEASVAAWRSGLVDSGVATHPPGFAPLVIEGEALYLARYYHYDNQLQKKLEFLAGETVPGSNPDALKEALFTLFPKSEITPDWQKVSAALAMKKRFCVISGGPGTGKTTTVLKLLAALCEVNNQKQPEQLLRIRLAAPTGKAAARMQESIRSNLPSLDCSKSIVKQLEVEACTLHRLLGYVRHSVNFRHNAAHPLALDVLVIDESSMIDSAMMAKLLDALPANARIILLGDKDQLAAVEPGSPFAQICSQFGFSEEFAQQLGALTETDLAGYVSTEPKLLADNLVFLRHSYRFGSDSGIGELARAVNGAEFGQAFKLMIDPDLSDISWQDYKPAEFRHYNAKEVDPLKERVSLGFADYMDVLKNSAEIKVIFNAYSQFCILTAVRRGYSGVEDINRLVAGSLGFPLDKHWYHGRPIMVTQNDYQTGLYNGDVGICLDIDDKGMRVYFPTSDGFKDFIPSRVPHHETAFAMTVHKSQGSEFSEVLFLIPDRNSPILTKSLIYTAITRAKNHIELWGDESVFLDVN